MNSRKRQSFGRESDLECHLLSDFTSDSEINIQLGLRVEPSEFNARENCFLLFLCIHHSISLDDTSRLEIENIRFMCDDDDSPPGPPTIMKRSASVYTPAKRKETTVPLSPHRGRSSALSVLEGSAEIIGRNRQCAIIRLSYNQQVNGPQPESAEFTILACDFEKSVTVALIPTCHVILGAIFDKSRSTLTGEVFYSQFLHWLSLFHQHYRPYSATNSPDMSQSTKRVKKQTEVLPDTLSWIHGAIIAFVRNLVDCKELANPDMLKFLSLLLSNECLDEWVLLSAVGNVLSVCDDLSDDEKIAHPGLTRLWRLPAVILQKIRCSLEPIADVIKDKDKLSVRTALRFLKDHVSLGSPYSYLSAVVPFMSTLNVHVETPKKLDVHKHGDFSDTRMRLLNLTDVEATKLKDCLSGVSSYASLDSLQVALTNIGIKQLTATILTESDRQLEILEDDLEIWSLAGRDIEASQRDRDLTGLERFVSIHATAAEQAARRKDLSNRYHFALVSWELGYQTIELPELSTTFITGRREWGTAFQAEAERKETKVVSEHFHVRLDDARSKLALCQSLFNDLGSKRHELNAAVQRLTTAPMDQQDQQDLGAVQRLVTVPRDQLDLGAVNLIQKLSVDCANKAKDFFSVVAASTAAPVRCHILGLEASFCAEIEAIEVLHRDGVLSTEMFCERIESMLQNAPTMRAALNIYKLVSKGARTGSTAGGGAGDSPRAQDFAGLLDDDDDDDGVAILSFSTLPSPSVTVYSAACVKRVEDEIVSMCKSINFEDPTRDSDREYVACLHVVKTAKELTVRTTILLALLNNSTFHMPIGSHSVEMLALVLRSSSLRHSRNQYGGRQVAAQQQRRHLELDQIDPVLLVSIHLWLDRLVEAGYIDYSPQCYESTVRRAVGLWASSTLEDDVALWSSKLEQLGCNSALIDEMQIDMKPDLARDERERDDKQHGMGHAFKSSKHFVLLETLTWLAVHHVNSKAVRTDAATAVESLMEHRELLRNLPRISCFAAQRLKRTEISVVPQIFERSGGLHRTERSPFLANLVVNLMKRTARNESHIAAHDAISCLMDGFESVDVRDQSNPLLRTVFKVVFGDVAVFLIKKLEQQETKSGVDKQLSALLLHVHRPSPESPPSRGRAPYPQLVLSPQLWSRLVCFNKTFSLHLVDRVEQWHKELFHFISTGNISVYNIKTALSLKNELTPVCQALHINDGYQEIEFIVREMDELYNNLVVLRDDVMSPLMRECKESQVVDKMFKSWTNIRLTSIRQMLTLGAGDHQSLVSVRSDDSDGGVLLQAQPMPPLLLKFCGWLADVSVGHFFKTFWESNIGGDNGSPAHIAQAVKAWLDWHDNMLNGSLLLGQLDRFGDTLMKERKDKPRESEIAIFIKSISRVTCETSTVDGSIGYGVVDMIDDTQEREKDFLDHLLKWKHVQNLHLRYDKMCDMLAAARWSVVESDHAMIDSVLSTLRTLEAAIVSHGPWAQQPVQRVYEQYWSLAESILPSVATIQPELLRALKVHQPLLTWLRSIPDNERFKTSIEMARSMSQELAPAELWDSASGRVNERYLSTVGNVRSYLHTYLYKCTQPCESWSEFVEVFSQLNPDETRKIVEDMGYCSDSRVLAALQTFIGKDVSASSRLQILYSPVSEAKWVCAVKAGAPGRGSVDSGTATVCFTYQATDSEGSRECVRKEYSNEGLADFQGMVVLERNMDTNKATKGLVGQDDSATVDLFLLHFNWMKKLAETCSALYRTGHFDHYPEFSLEISVDEPEETFQSHATVLQNVLGVWSQDVTSIRQSFYFVNFFDLKRCFELLQQLKQHAQLASVDQDHFESVTAALLPLVSCVNAQFSYAQDSLVVLVRQFLHSWNQLAAQFTAAAPSHTESLLMLAKAMEESFPLIPMRLRLTDVADMVDHVVTARLGKGVYVAQGLSLAGQVPKGQYDQLLTLSAIQGYLPEFETCICCNAQTTSEHVCMLIYRWYHSMRLERTSRMFAIVEAEKLQYDVQHIALSLLRELLSNPAAIKQPLVIITENDQCHLASQFMHNCITKGVLPPAQLVDSCRQLRASCHESTYPGAGKSFHIRGMTEVTRGSREWDGGGAVESKEDTEPMDSDDPPVVLAYSHVPINATHTPEGVIIHRLNEATRRHQGDSAVIAGTLVHLDLASTCGESLLGSLFALIVLGVLADCSSTATYSFDPTSTQICVELATGLQYKSFKLYEALGVISHSTSEDSLCLDRASMERGMGSEQFYDACGGEIGLRSDRESAHAHHRLSYVVKALEILNGSDSEFEGSEGSFPTDFSLSLYEESVITVRAYELLTKACGGRDPAECDDDSWRPSFWCIWSFINIVYMQLQDIEDKESPISLACCPDEGNQLMSVEFEIAMKQRVKGEMVKFIVRTAKEFVTNHTPRSQQDNSNLVGIFVWNCSFIRESTVSADMDFAKCDLAHFANHESIAKYFWKRENYDNDGKPVFKSPEIVKVLDCTSNRQPSYFRYLYFRESECRWVLSDSVTYTGAVIGFSVSDNDDLEIAQFQLRNIEAGKLMVRSVATKVGEGWDLKGFHQCKSGPGIVASGEDDGLYLPVEPLYSHDTETNSFSLCQLKCKGTAFEKGIEVGARVYVDASALRIKEVGTGIIAECAGQWYTAVISGTGGDGSLDVEFLKPELNNGQCNVGLPSYRWRPIGLPAKVTHTLDDGRCDVTFDDVSLNDGVFNKGIRDYRLRPHEPLQILHYYKSGGSPRHLYFDAHKKKNYWVIAKTCNADESGMHLKSKWLNGPLKSGMWDYSGANIEMNMKIRYVHSNDCVPIFAAAQSAPVNEIQTRLEDAGLSEGPQKWGDSNHESFLFNTRTGLVSFLSLDPVKLRQNMHPVLLSHLKTNHVEVGEDLKVLSPRLWEILSGLTGVARSYAEAQQMMGGQFCLTGDSLLKILAIVHRAKAKIPVVLMGECGCGKTMLISFLCKWLGVLLLSLDVHGGTVEADICKIFSDAKQALDRGLTSTVFVFLDEVNTCDHMGLITEAVCHRSIYGERLHEGIQILAALNPYRKRKFPAQEMGLSVSLGLNPAESEMSKLVYRVRPIPSTLKEFVFDFGSLDSATELLYIQSMIRGDAGIRRVFGPCNIKVVDIARFVTRPPSGSVVYDKRYFSEEKAGEFTCLLDNRKFQTYDLVIDHLEKQHAEAVLCHELDILGVVINHAQEYVREVEGDVSVVSLRDVKRALLLMRWFYEELHDDKHLDRDRSIARAATLALAHVYYYRLSTERSREGLFDRMAESITAPSKAFNCMAKKTVFFSSIVTRAQEFFVENLIVDEDVSVNQALKENVFVAMVSILNKIPIFIVGKPGTSKTLAIQVIENNLQGAQSPQDFWKVFPAVTIVQYQCSPMSTAQSIEFQYKAAKDFQEHSSNMMTVLLLDEVGLAENSPDMPLKVLHYMLVDPPIAIVGISNWTLDSSKMNRAILLQRPEPSLEDLIVTGKGIVAVSDVGSPRQSRQPSKSQTWLSPFTRAVHRVYTEQKLTLDLKRDFFGMRDFYSMAKFLRVNITSELTPAVLTRAVCRNFGGLPRAKMETLCTDFARACFPRGTVEPICDLLPVVDAINENLRSRSARNLMVLSENDAVLPLLFGCGILDEANVSVLVGSRFKDDMEELFLIQQITKVKMAMAEGKVAILLNNDAIYESLYDVLNQRYVRRKDPDSGEVLRLLRIAIGPRSQLCRVHDNFKIILVVKQSQAYEKLDLPLLNRFEKQVISPTDVLNAQTVAVKQKLERWCDEVQKETKVDRMDKIFCGYYDGTISSLLLSLTTFGRNSSLSDHELLLRAQEKLLKMATPASVLYSRKLMALVRGSGEHFGGDEQTIFSSYFRIRSDFFTSLRTELASTAATSGATATLGAVGGTGIAPVSRLFFFATRSPIDQMDVSIRRMQDRLQGKTSSPRMDVDGGASSSEVEDIVTNDVQTIPLSAVSSERIFDKAIRDFYSSVETQGPRLMVILCDPLHCTLAAITHAQHLVERCYHAHSQAPHPHARHVALVVNLPLGIFNRTREFTVDMYAPWSYAFVDELASPHDDRGPSLMDMLYKPVAELCNHRAASEASPDRLFLRGFFLKNFNRALKQCRVSALVDKEDPRGHLSRVKMLKELLELEDFLTFIAESVQSCLESVAKNPNEMLLHVQLAYETDMGSLRRSLTLAIESIIISALAYVVRVLDENYNLSWLHSRISGSTDIATSRSITHTWLELAHKVLDLPSKFGHFTEVSSLLKKGNKEMMQISDKVVSNSGLYGAVACRFPFSEKFIALHFTDAVRKEIERRVNTDRVRMVQSLDSIISNGLGSAFAEQLYSCVLEEDPDAYLHDFVATRMHPAENITFRTQFEVTRAIFRASSADAEPIFTPAAVHMGYWNMESRLFHTISAVKFVKSAWLVAQKKFWRMSGYIKTNFEVELVKYLEDRSAHELLDSKLVTFFFELLWYTISNIVGKSDVDTRKLFGFWLDLWTSVQPDLNAIYVLIPTFLASGHVNTELEPLMRKKWVLSAWTVVLRHYLSREEGAITLEALKVILDSLVDADPADATSIAKFMAACYSCGCERDSPLKCNYVRKFIEPEIKALYDRGLSAGDPMNLVAALGSMLSHRSISVSIADTASPAKDQALLLDRAVVNCLYALSKLSGVEVVNAWIREMYQVDNISNCTRVAQLLVERIEDSDELDSQAPPDVSSALALSNLESIAQLKEALARHGISILTELAGARLLTAQSAITAIQWLRGIPIHESVSFPALSVFPHLEAQMYFLTLLRRLSGKPGLVHYLRQRNHPCLPPPAVPIDPSIPVIKSFDPFSSLAGKDVYAACCVATMQAKLRSDDEPLVAWSNSPIAKKLEPFDKVSVLLASVCTQLAANDLSTDKSLTSKIVNLVTSMCAAPVPQSTMKLAKDACKNLLEHKRGAKIAFDYVRNYLNMHIGLVTMSDPTSWLYTLLSDPVKLKTALLPSMSDTELAQILLISSAGGSDVGVYACPNGHIYTIGQCTRPWVTAKCPQDGCGEIIGGAGHKEARGNRQMGTARDLRLGQKEGMNQAGYMISCTESEEGYDVSRTNKLTTVFLRYIIHSVMLMSAELYPIKEGKCSNGGLSGAAELMYPDRALRQLPPPQEVINKLKKIQEQDWAALCKVMQMDPDDIAMGFHMALHKLRSTTIMNAECITTAFERLRYEQLVEEKIVEKTFTSETSKATIAKERKQYETDNIDKHLQNSLKDELYGRVTELSDPRLDSAVGVRAILWRYREQTTFEKFSADFERLGRSSDIMYPVLSTVLKNESKLGLIKYAADVLAWQSLLFKHLKSGAITRDEAAAISNRQFVEEHVPVGERAAARAALTNYIVAFNATFHSFNGEPLCECTVNIFSQQGLVMTEDLSVAFSLPNRTKKPNLEFMESRNLCSGFILEQLQRVQDRVSTALLRDVEAEVDTVEAAAGAAAVRVQADGADDETTMQVDVAPALHNRGLEQQAPLFTITTPLPLVKSKLLKYDRAALMRCVVANAHQELEFGQGELLGYDYVSIESDLRDLLLPSAQPFGLAHRDFAFKGEIRERAAESTMIAMLSNRVRQIKLPDTVFEQVWQEIDTEPRRVGLSSQIEDCIEFIASAGASTSKLDGNVTLTSFILDTLQVDPSSWQEVSCPTLTSSVCLHHLKSLYREMIRRESGGLLFPGLNLTEYGAELSDGDAEALRVCARDVVDLACLLDSLEDFIWLKLSRQALSEFSGRALSLHENMSYVHEGGEWFDADSFPQLKVEQAYAVFEELKQMCT